MFWIFILCLIPPFLLQTELLNILPFEICLFILSIAYQNCVKYISCVFSFEDKTLASPSKVCVSPSKMSMDLATMSTSTALMSMSPERPSPQKN